MSPKTTGKSDIAVRVRMAPSPTGPMHIGSARTALFNWLFARKHGGVFVLRIEDTDKERSKKEFEDELIAGFRWLGIDWDEGPDTLGAKDEGGHGPYRQSERGAIYRKYLEKLIASGDAYYCYCTKEDLEAQRQAMLASGLAWKYNGHCRSLKAAAAGKQPQVIRFKIPEVKVEFKDLIRGKVVFDATLFGDQVIAKDLDSPLYNFAVVVDDEDMKISHVIRGEEHLGNTPKQILMMRALGFTEPIFAHIPLILNPDRSKMSKRFGDSALSEFKDKGYLPEALINFLALMGWHPTDDREVFSQKDLIAAFDLERVQKAGAVFNPEKLDWLNREHMKKYSNAELAVLARPFVIKKYPDVDPAFFERLVGVERTRANTLSDFAEIGNFFFKLPDYEPKLLVWKESSLKDVKNILERIHQKFSDISPADYHRETLSGTLTSIISEMNRGMVLWPLRVALSGLGASPDPIDIMEVLGKDESLTRIKIAIQKLG
jgi:glutamyl-tRNA synthetase